MFDGEVVVIVTSGGAMFTASFSASENFIVAGSHFAVKLTLGIVLTKLQRSLYSLPISSILNTHCSRSCCKNMYKYNAKINANYAAMKLYMYIVYMCIYMYTYID